MSLTILAHAAEPLLQWLSGHNVIVVFPTLALGILGLPIPDETLITMAGWLISQDRWPLIPTFLAVVLGAVCGISLSYLVGRTAGHYLIKKYGRWIGITESRIKSTHDWFEKIGKWTLVIGYFIPGVRHLTGYVAGTLQLNTKEFMLYAYSGALLWSIIFLTIGYFFGSHF